MNSHVFGTPWAQAKVTAQTDLVSCPFLTRLSVTGHVTLSRSVTLAIGKAVRKGKLPSMESLNLDYRYSKPSRRMENLFGEIILSYVTHLSFCDINTINYRAVSQKCVKLKSLSLHKLTKSGFGEVMKSIEQGFLTNLRKLCLSMFHNEIINLKTMKPEKVPQLEHLGLQRCIAWKGFLEQLSPLVSHWTLHTLDISHSRGINGELSILLQHEFPSLKSLILRDCGLNGTDLISLDQANARGRLPVLVDLNLSGNYHLTGSIGQMSSKWINLKRLELETDFEDLRPLVVNGCIPSVRELRLEVFTEGLIFLKQLKYLERLDIVTLGDRYRQMGVELFIINTDLERFAVDAGLINSIAN